MDKETDGAVPAQGVPEKGDPGRRVPGCDRHVWDRRPIHWGMAVGPAPGSE